MHHKIIKTSLCLAFLHLTISAASAQFVWIDAKGTKQYSDQPPPSSIPKSRIMKEPGLELRNSSMDTPSIAPAAVVAAGADVATATQSANAPKAPMSTAEKNAEFTKRQAEQVEKERKTADDAKEAAAKAKNCERVQAYARSLQSGERIATMDKNGEKTYLTDEKRAQETSDAMRAMNGCK
ncbi:MAG: DUF4124 domain-containing protein [Pseudomonadota bacterium]